MLFSNLLHLTVDPINLPLEGSVRLVSNGVETNIGRVEVYKKGEWTSVYAEDWNMAGAEVLCRQAGFTAATAFFLYVYSQSQSYLCVQY